MCDLGLCPFSGLVCDLLLRGGRGLSLNEHWQEGISFHNCDVHCLEDTGVVWCLSHLGARWRRGFSPELPRARKSRPNSGRVSIFSIFPTCGPRFRDLRRVARERERVTPHIRIRIIRNMKSLEGAFERSGAQWVMSHMNASFSLYKWVMSRIRTSHTTHNNESRRGALFLGRYVPW